MKKVEFMCNQLLNVIKILMAGAVAINFVACGGTGQDEGSPSQIHLPVNGVVIDGYLARTRVFVDSNNNGTRDSWEPTAFTDNDGYYSFNPLTSINYCASDATAEQAQYCLVIDTDMRDVVVRVDGGYDVLTGEPFYGQLSRRVSVDTTADSVDARVISPLTTLMTNMQDTDNRQRVLQSIGISEPDMDIDYLNDDGNGGVNTYLLKASLKIHKTVTVLSDQLEDNYDSLGDELGTPNDASAWVYNQIANELNSSGTTLDFLLNDEASLSNVMKNSENAVRALYQRKEFDMPQNIDTTQIQRRVNVATRIGSVVESLIDDAEVETSGVRGGVKVLESIVVKALEENGQDPSLDRSLDFVTDINNISLVNALRDGMSNEGASVSILSRNDFSGDDFDSEEQISSVASLPADAKPFRQVGGLKVRVSDLDLANGPGSTDADDSEVEIYFRGDSTLASGELKACIKHIKGANTVTGELDSGSTRGELVSGYWSLLGSNLEEGAYSLLITISFLNTTYQAIMKPGGKEVVDNTMYDVLRFDFDDDISDWYSEDGLTELAGGLPQTNEECAARLPSRIGLN